VRKKRKASFGDPYSNLVLCGTVSTGKGDIRQENFASICSVEQLKNNGFSFTQIGNICLLY
jgi:hypothetical protein